MKESDKGTEGVRAERKVATNWDKKEVVPRLISTDALN
jgi:hypothetical protein